MRYLILFLTAISLVCVGCDRDSAIFFGPDADGYYEGWFYMDSPELGFDHSFHGTLRVYDNSNMAILRDNRGREYHSRRVDYEYWPEELRIWFRIRETRWSPHCGHEVYYWEMLLSGRIDYNERYRGDIRADIDPDDYYSDHCYMDWNPPPRYVGTFNLELYSDPWF